MWLGQNKLSSLEQSTFSNKASLLGKFASAYKTDIESLQCCACDGVPKPEPTAFADCTCPIPKPGQGSVCVCVCLCVFVGLFEREPGCGREPPSLSPTAVAASRHPTPYSYQHAMRLSACHAVMSDASGFVLNQCGCQPPARVPKHCLPYRACGSACRALWALQGANAASSLGQPIQLCLAQVVRSLRKEPKAHTPQARVPSLSMAWTLGCGERMSRMTMRSRWVVLGSKGPWHHLVPLGQLVP